MSADQIPPPPRNLGEAYHSHTKYRGSGTFIPSNIKIENGESFKLEDYFHYVPLSPNVNRPPRGPTVIHMPTPTKMRQSIYEGPMVVHFAGYAGLYPGTPVYQPVYYVPPEDANPTKKWIIALRCEKDDGSSCSSSH